MKQGTKKTTQKRLGPSLGFVGWSLILTSPVVLLCVLRARARRWFIRAILSVCIPLLRAVARALGLVKASEWDPHARTIEDPVRRSTVAMKMCFTTDMLACAETIHRSTSSSQIGGCSLPSFQFVS